MLKKLFTFVGILAISALLKTGVAAATYWDISGDKDITYYLGATQYPHHYTITQDADGNLGGSGYYIPNDDYSEVIIGGNVTGDIITMSIDYTGLNPLYALEVRGTIASDGSVTGTADSNTGQHFTWIWPAGTADNDADDDGVTNDIDLCEDTDSDEPENWGTNRWMWDEEEGWIVNSPETKKGTANGANPGFTIEDTLGCSCTQILDEIREVVGEDFEGHYKNMCSKSIVEDWIEGRYYVGPTYVETVTVPANSPASTMSVNPLKSDVTYFLKATGTADAGDGIEFDARYSYRTPTSTEWTDLVSTYESYGAELLDLFFNGTTPWGEFSDTHEYDATVTGDGINASFLINDVYYINNAGSLSVEIVEDKWVELW